MEKSEYHFTLNARARSQELTVHFKFIVFDFIYTYFSLVFFFLQFSLQVSEAIPRKAKPIRIFMA